MSLWQAAAPPPAPGALQGVLQGLGMETLELWHVISLSAAMLCTWIFPAVSQTTLLFVLVYAWWSGQRPTNIAETFGGYAYYVAASCGGLCVLLAAVDLIRESNSPQFMEQERERKAAAAAGARAAAALH